MKFLKTEAFEKHLDESLPKYPSSLYGIAVKDPFERRFVIERLLQKIHGESLCMKASEVSIQTFLNELSEPSFLVSKRVLVYDEVDQLRKEESIAKELKVLPKRVCVIIGGSHIHFYESLKKEMVLLDLSGEKPWERTSRLKRWLLQEVYQNRKTLTADAAAYLSEFCINNFENMIQEVQKLITYIGDGTEIDLKAIEEIGSFQIIQGNWQLSESMIWGGDIHYSTLHKLSEQEVYLFLGQLRYQLQLGLVVASCLERKEEQMIQKEYPNLPIKIINKYKQLASSFSTFYFREGLKDLFELELQSRMRVASFMFLIERFILRLKMRVNSD